uniref:Uncharacterized protein n=1 Tax=Anopheles maculatus TaxID=74869 RepID=A0A182SFW0_9DIPT
MICEWSLMVNDECTTSIRRIANLTTYSGICEQQSLETTALQKKYLEQKNKRSLKKTEKKQAEQQQLQQQQTLSGNLQSSVHVVSRTNLMPKFCFLRTMQGYCIASLNEL